MVTAAKSMEGVDVVVVGAGSAGCLIAAKLAKAGRQVLTLDAGPPWQERDLISSHIWSRRIRWSGPFVETTGEDPYLYGFNNGWGYGGAANHHYGVWPRMHPEDFRMQSEYGRGLDWPIDYDTLRPFYDRIQTEVGIAGDDKAERWRPPSAPYPMPPLPAFRQGEIIAKGFEKLGKNLAPAPVAINTVPYGGRAACIYDGWCDAGCPTGALANPLVTYKREAESHGARFRPHARVLRLRSDGKDKVAGVEYVNEKNELVFQPASVVVLAAAVAQNPAILLNSTSLTNPRGIGNERGVVGRYFMTHPAAFITGLFEEQTYPHVGITHGNLICQDAYNKEGEDGSFGSYQWVVGSVMKPSDITGLAMSRPELMGARLEQFMQKAVKHMGAMFGMAEELPEAENRIELGADIDAFGRREPRVIHKFSSNTRALIARMVAEGEAIFRAAGCAKPRHQQITTHVLGGTIMGSDPSRSVCDSYGRVHSMRNVFVAGSGLYPTAGAVNPTFTLHALGLRSAEHIASNWGSYTG